MAEIFQPILPSISAGRLPPAPVQDKSGVIAGVVSVGAQVADVVSKTRDNASVNDFKSTIQSLQDQAGDTEKEVNSIAQQLVGADRTKVVALNRRLTRLALGQEQGRLTSSQANARASVEFKKLAAENPHLEQELRRVMSVSMFGISSGGVSSTGGGNILLKAAQDREKMVLDVMLRGNVTRRTAETFIQTQQDLEGLKQSNDVAMAQGTAGFNSVLSAVNASSQQIQYSLLGEMNSALVQNPAGFDPELFTATVTQAFLSLESDWTQTLAQRDVRLTDVQREELKSNMRDTRDAMITIGKSKDPLAHLTRINNIMDQEEKNVANTFIKNMGTQFQIMRQLGSDEQMFDTVFNTIPKAIGLLQRDNGKFDALVQAAENSADSDMIFALQYAQANPNLTVKQWRDQLNGKITGTTAQTELNRHISGQTLNSGPSVQPSEDAPTVFDFLSKNSEDVINSSVPTNISALYQPGFVGKMNQDAKLQKFVQNKIGNRMALMIPRITKVLTQKFATSELSRELELVVDEEALNEPIVTKRGLFSRSIKANKIFKIVPKGLDPKLFSNVPRINVQAAAIDNTISRELFRLDEYVAALSASGMSISQIKAEITKFTETAEERVEGQPVGATNKPEAKPQTIGNRGAFSFLREATSAELTTLQTSGKDKELRDAVDVEISERSEPASLDSLSLTPAQF